MKTLLGLRSECDGDSEGFGDSNGPIPSSCPTRSPCAPLPWEQFSCSMNHGDADEAAAPSPATSSRFHTGKEARGQDTCRTEPSQSKMGLWVQRLPEARVGDGNCSSQEGLWDAGSQSWAVPCPPGRAHRGLWCQRGAESAAGAAWGGDTGACALQLASASRLGMGRNRLKSPRFSLQTP